MNNLYYILDEQNNVVPAQDVMQWTKSPRSHFHVGLDHVGNVKISTVFLGLDHRFGDLSGPPIVFETMVFGGKYDEEMERYCTYDEAVKGHAWWVRQVKRSES